MLSIAGTFGIIEFRKLSLTVESLLEDNYASIQACNNMLEGLEREDSGILLCMMGQLEMGKASIFEGDSIFTNSLNYAMSKIAESDEDTYLNDIAKNYEIYKMHWQSLLENQHETFNMEWFTLKMRPSFNQLEASIKNLMLLNQTTMYEESFLLRDKAQRAVMPIFVAVIAALFFAILFNFFINYYFVSPILRLIRAIKNYRPMGKEIEANIETNDEIKMLEVALRELIQKLNRKIV